MRIQSTVGLPAAQSGVSVSAVGLSVSPDASSERVDHLRVISMIIRIL